MKKVTTIHDISARAGVSITTVSRFLNGNYSNMSEKTRKRLEQIVQELDYHPNSLARSLKSQNSGMVGCVMADMGNPFSALLIKGIQMICRSNGYKLMTLDADNDSLLEKEAYKILLDTPVEGIICNTTGNAAQEIESVSEKTPLVLADRVFPSKKEFDCVVSDNENATYECLRYLRNQGYERIAFFHLPWTRSVPAGKEWKRSVKARQISSMPTMGATYIWSTQIPWKRPPKCFWILSADRHLHQPFFSALTVK